MKKPSKKSCATPRRGLKKSKSPSRSKAGSATDTKSKKKINSCTKGKTGELDFVHFLKERGIDARRGQQYEGSSDSPDIVTAGGCLRNTHIEVKRTEVTSIYKWLDQANTDADICKTPVVAHRKNGERWVVIMDARDFISMMQDLDRKVDHAAILKAVMVP